MKTIGIIGGGQLGFMLIEYGIMKILKSCFLDLKILVLDNNPECSCAALADKYNNIQIIEGDLMEEDDINGFVQKCDVVTWEIEHFNTKVHQPEKIIPNVNVLSIIQNKISQKQFYTQHHIQTAKYTFGKHGVDFNIKRMNNEISVISGKDDSIIFSGKHIVVKNPLNGYDGRAVQIISADEICESDMTKDVILIEEYVTNKIELSVIVASDKNGEIYSYECIGMDFHAKTNILDKCFVGLEKLKEIFRSKYPCGNNSDSYHDCMIEMADESAKKVEIRAIELAKKVIKFFEIKSGILAVEMFYCIDNDILLVNEVAPRVHNSGHHTIHSHNISQFEIVARMLLNIDLVQPKMLQYYVMKNILGPDNIKNDTFHISNGMCIFPDTSPHLIDYCKYLTKPNRKIGHITFIANTQSEAMRQYCECKHISVECGKRNCKVGIIMGSSSDLTVLKEAADTLRQLGIEYEMTVVSAHRTPERLYKYASLAKERGLNVIIAGAGGAAHLPGMVASITTIPVIGVPVKTSTLNGMDSLYSIVQMPPGVPVACMAINGAKNAAIFAAQILSLCDKELNTKLNEFRQRTKETVYNSALLK